MTAEMGLSPQRYLETEAETRRGGLVKESQMVLAL